MKIIPGYNLRAIAGEKMILMQLTPEHQILCNLIRVALWPGQDEEVLLSGIGQLDWEEVISFASRQGVLGVSFDGFSGVKKCTGYRLSRKHSKSDGN